MQYKLFGNYFRRATVTILLAAAVFAVSGCDKQSNKSQLSSNTVSLNVNSIETSTGNQSELDSSFASSEESFDSSVEELLSSTENEAQGNPSSASSTASAAVSSKTSSTASWPTSSSPASSAPSSSTPSAKPSAPSSPSDDQAAGDREFAQTPVVDKKLIITEVNKMQTQYKAKLYQLGSCEPAPWYGEGAVNQMMGYVIVTEDNKLVVIDGGYASNAEPLLELLKKESGGSKPVVSAWFLTHCHSDHVLAFTEIVDKHLAEVDIKAVYSANPTRDEIAEYVNGESVPTYDKLSAALERLPGLCHSVHTGDKYSVGTTEFEILFAPYHRYAASNNLNNTSIVIRTVLGGQSVLFLADLAESAGADLIAEVPAEKLKADIVQMAHHGQNGVSKSVYDIIRPSLCLFNTPLWLWNNDIGKGYNTHTFLTVEVRKWMESLGVEYAFKNDRETLLLKFPIDFSGSDLPKAEHTK